MDKRVKIAFIAVLAVIAAALIFGIGYAVWEQASAIPTKYENYSVLLADEGIESDADVTPNTYYVCNVSDFGSNDIYLAFADGSYTYRVGASEIASGSYDMSHNVANITYTLSGGSNTDTSTDNVIFDDAHAFFVTAVCTGDVIPDSATFNAVVSRRTSSDEAYQYTFKDDGTYELLFGKRRGRTNWTKVTGHYTRNDDGTISITLINNTTGEENDSLPFYIYNGHIVDSFYNPLSEEEFLAAQEELQNATQQQ